MPLDILYNFQVVVGNEKALKKQLEVLIVQNQVLNERLKESCSDKEKTAVRNWTEHLIVVCNSYLYSLLVSWKKNKKKHGLLNIM